MAWAPGRGGGGGGGGGPLNFSAGRPPRGPSPRAGGGVSGVGPLRVLVRPDRLRAVHDLLLVEADEGAHNGAAGGRVDHPKAREGLARDLAEVLSRHEDVRGLPVREDVRHADHEALREDEVETSVARMGDLREGLAHSDDVEGGESKDFAEPARFDRGRVVRDRLEGEVGRDDGQALAVHEVPGDGAVEPAAQEEDAPAHGVHTPTYFAYTDRAGASSSPPGRRAGPSGKTVRGRPSASTMRMAPARRTRPTFASLR